MKTKMRFLGLLCAITLVGPLLAADPGRAAEAEEDNADPELIALTAIAEDPDFYNMSSFTEDGQPKTSDEIAWESVTRQQIWHDVYTACCQEGIDDFAFIEKTYFEYVEVILHNPFGSEAQGGEGDEEMPMASFSASDEDGGSGAAGANQLTVDDLLEHPVGPQDGKGDEEMLMASSAASDEDGGSGSAGASQLTVDDLFDHHGTKDFRCIECGFKSDRGSSVRRHIEGVHLDLKPYKCDWEGCSHEAVAQSDINRHVLQVHKKDQPFQCPRCDRKFKLEWRLNRHMERHSDKTYSCFCGYQAETRNALGDHKRKYGCDPEYFETENK